jgi:hypothetical protein
VTPAGGPAFAIGVNGVPVQIELPSAVAMPAAVHVASPLAFDGVARIDDLAIQLARAADVAQGRVRVTAGMSVRSARTTGAGVTVDIVVAPGVVVRDVVVAEDLLTLNALLRSPGAVAGGARAWLPRGPVVHLYPIDGAGPPISVETSRPFGLALERRGDERDGLIPVQATWSDGAALTGRVGLAELREIGPSDTFLAAPVEDSAPGAIDECGQTSTPPGMFRGMRRAAGGAVIYAEPGRGPWARVSEPVDLEVEYASDARYAAISRAPGIVQLGTRCSALAHAWVETRALSGPRGAP